MMELGLSPSMTKRLQLLAEWQEEDEAEEARRVQQLEYLRGEIVRLQTALVEADEAGKASYSAGYSTGQAEINKLRRQLTDAYKIVHENDWTTCRPEPGDPTWCEAHHCPFPCVYGLAAAWSEEAKA